MRSVRTFGFARPGMSGFKILHTRLDYPHDCQAVKLAMGCNYFARVSNSGRSDTISMCVLYTCLQWDSQTRVTV